MRLEPQHGSFMEDGFSPYENLFATHGDAREDELPDWNVTGHHSRNRNAEITKTERGISLDAEVVSAVGLHRFPLPDALPDTDSNMG